MTYRSSQSVHWCDCARDEETKKDIETLQWQTKYSPRPPTSSVRNQVLHWEMIFGR